MQPQTRQYVLGLALAVLLSVPCSAQPAYTPPSSGAPVITGYGGIFAERTPSEKALEPEIAPIFIIPFGDRWLVEAELELGADIAEEDGERETEWEKALEYAQVDFIASDYATVVFGRFLTPFGIYNERLHPGWIRNLPLDPIVTAFELNSTNGAQIRGAIPAGPANFTYAVYAGGSSENSWIESARNAGGRGSLFFPSARLEIGGSYQRRTTDERVELYGADLIWQSASQPFDLRAEYVTTNGEGRGHWVEGAYRLRRIPFARKFFRNSQIVLRAEGFSAGDEDEMTELAAAARLQPVPNSGGGNLPEGGTRRISAGWNYWLHQNVRASVAYTRESSAGERENMWSAGLTYRFLIPTAKGAR